VSVKAHQREKKGYGAASMDRRAIAREITLIYVVVAGLTFAITRLRDIPPWDQWVHLGVGALFLLTAMRLAQREPGGMRRMGIALAGLLEPPDDEDGGLLGMRELGRTTTRTGACWACASWDAACDAHSRMVCVRREWRS
jgi:hypothetical protein